MRHFKYIDVKRAVSWVGTLLMLASLGFIARRIFVTHGDVDFSVFTDPVILAGLISVALLEGVGIILASLNYRAIVANVSGIRVRPTLAVVVYTLSNLYKYIPGGVMYVLGRNRMAVEDDSLSHTKVAASTVLEGVFIVIAVILIAAVFSFEHSMYYIRQVERLPLVGLILFIVLAAAAPIVYNNRHRLSKLLREFLKDANVFRPGVIVIRLCCVLVLMGLWTFTFLATLMLLGQPMTLSLGITVMGLYLLAWLAGFLTPGAPSGLGVREVVMMMFMSGTLNEGILISAMVMHRLLTVLGDVSAYGMALAYARAKRLDAERVA
ncbi:MAG: hypothetical protein FWB88_09520 [Defluviitaleaceae bacterium]|nr:hypothetical protein [Defluviitaleaceae bacterium]MCL2240871.1 hypothetical protein [Defluviitaleaceae bacterium]